MKDQTRSCGISKIKTTFLGLAVGSLLCSITTIAYGQITLSVKNPAQVVEGSNVEVDLLIENLGDREAPSVGAFSIDFEFEPDVLEFFEFNFSDQLGEDSLNGLCEPGSDSCEPNIITAFQISRESVAALNGTQAGSFRLGTLKFQATDSGTSQLDIIRQLFADASGELLPVVTDHGNGIEVISLSELPLTDNQRRTLEAIIKGCERGRDDTAFQRDCNDLLNSGNSLGPFTNAVSQITPDQAGAPTNTGKNSMIAQIMNVGSRLAALRGGATGFSIAGLNLYQGDQQLTGEQIASMFPGAQPNGGGASGDILDFGRLGVFVNGAVIIGDRDQTNREEGFDFDTFGITVGADYRFTDNLVFGGALAYLNTDTDFDDNRGDLDSDGFGATLYGTYYRTQFYVDGSLSFGTVDYDQKRKIRYTLPTAVVDNTMKSDFDGNQVGVTLGTGYEFTRGGFTFGPVGRLEYIRLDVDDYREKASNPSANGAGWTLRMDDQKLKSFTTRLGGQVSYAISWSGGVLLPQMRLDWVHEFDGDSQTIDGQFLGDPSKTRFGIETDKPDRDYADLGIGLSAQFAKGRSAYIHYRTFLGLDDLNANNFGIGLRFEL